MSGDVGVAVVIERPITEVAAYTGDASNWPEWSRRIDAAAWKTDPPHHLGSRILLRTRFLGRTRDELYEIFEWAPGEQIAVRTVASTFPVSVSLAWRPVGDRVTHMTVRFHAEPRGLRRLMSPLVARRVRRSMTRDLDAVGKRLERGG